MTRAVSFKDCCARIGISVRTGKRQLADGQFPVPYLRRFTPRSPYRFSESDIERYLTTDATADARPLRRVS